MNKIFGLGSDENEKQVKITIFDNNNWQPDLDFYIEIYDPNGAGHPKFFGDDTRCKVTILDEDFPGCLTFEETQLTVNKN